MVKINSMHSHDIENAHILSFRSLNPKTKTAFFEYFDSNMPPGQAVAHHASLIMSKPQAQINLADASLNPKVRKVCDLFDEWREENLGPRNGDGIWDTIDVNQSKYSAAGAKVNFNFSVYENNFSVNFFVYLGCLSKGSVRYPDIDRRDAACSCVANV